MADFVTIASGELTARISPLGAELWSLTDAEGREYMTDADPAFWSAHAPLLFPIVGTLNGGRYRLGDRSYELPRHGFARTSRFDPVGVDGTTALFRLTDSDATRAVYPFAFVLEMAFRLEGWTLAMEARVSNPGETALPFSFGFHPAFAWPLPGGASKEAHRIAFAQHEPQPIRRLDPASGLVLPSTRPTPIEDGELAPAPSLFEADALIWDHLSSRALRFGDEGGAWLDIAFPDTPMLGIWQKPGARFLCIEFWQGIADPIGYDGDFHDKPGVVSLVPGGSRSFRMEVTVHTA